MLMLNQEMQNADELVFDKEGWRETHSCRLMKKVFKKIRFPKMSLFLAITFLATCLFPSIAAGMHISEGSDE